jgi:hypothetical protein
MRRSTTVRTTLTIEVPKSLLAVSEPESASQIRDPDGVATGFAFGATGGQTSVSVASKDRLTPQVATSQRDEETVLRADQQNNVLKPPVPNPHQARFRLYY